MSNQLIGGISVQLAAEVAALKKDMDQAEKIVGSSAGVMSKSVDGLKGAFVGLAGVLSVGAMAAWVQSAINAADATKQFAQKTGVAAEDVAGLQLAFKQGGVEAGSLQGAIAKMSKQMAEGSAGFKTLGVETRNADGTMRNVKDVLYDVADATSDLRDGIAKTATLQQIFGKSAAELIPTLNEGSEGLRNMAEMAEKLGLVISAETAEQADKFNDTVELLGMGLTGVGQKVSAQLLPTLTNLSDSFLTSMTEGDRLSRMADVLASAMKGVYSVVLGVIEVFNTFGKLIGGEVAALMAEISGLGEAIVKVFQGDFKGAAQVAQEGFRLSAQISKETSADIAQGWQATGKAISTAWNTTGSTTVEVMAGMQKKGKELTLLTKEQEEAAKRAAAEETKRLAEVQKTMEALDKQIALMDMEAQAGQKLTGVQKTSLDLMIKLQNGTLKLTEAEKKALMVKLEAAFASEALQTELANEKKQMEENRKENDAYVGSLHKSTEAINAEVSKLRESNAMFGKTKEEIAKLEIARLEEQAVAKDRLATWAEEAMLGDEIVEQYREQARGLRELAQLKGDRVHLEIAKESADAWKKTSEEIGSSFTDSLFRAFESGKDFGEAFLDATKNLFKTTVLKLLVQPVQAGLNGFIGGMLGGGSGGSAGGLLGGLFGGGEEGSGLGSLGGLGGLLGMAGSGFGAGLGAVFGGTGTMGALSAGASLVGTGTMAGASSGLGMMAGAAAPWVMGAMALKSLTDYKITPDGGGLTASLTSGGTSTGKVGAFQQFKQSSSGFLSGGNTVNRSWSEADAGTTGYLIASVKANTEAGKEYARVLGLNADAMDGFTKNVEINTSGMDEAAAKAAIDAELAKFAAEQVEAAYGTSIATFQKSGETMSDTLRRMAETQVAFSSINELGGVFSRLAVLGQDGRDGMVQLAGGIDALMKKSQDFVSEYYSIEEQTGLTAKNILAQLKAAGVEDAASLTDKSQYRAMVEAIDVATQAGRQQLNAMLTLAPAFAQISDTLASGGLNLGSLAAQAPQVTALDPLFEANSSLATSIQTGQDATTSAITNGSTAVVEAINTAMDGVAAEMRAAVQVSTDAVRALTAKLESIETTNRLNLAGETR